jgi:hypothetical protein
MVANNAPQHLVYSHIKQHVLLLQQKESLNYISFVIRYPYLWLAFNADNIIQMTCASIANTFSKVLAMPNIYVSSPSILPCFYNSKVSPISFPSPTKHGS